METFQVITPGGSCPEFFTYNRVNSRTGSPEAASTGGWSGIPESRAHCVQNRFDFDPEPVYIDYRRDGRLPGEEWFDLGEKGEPGRAAEPKRGSRNKNPNIVHPSVPGAVGSRVSRHQEGRDMGEEARALIRDTIEKVRGTDSSDVSEP